MVKLGLTSDEGVHDNEDVYDRYQQNKGTARESFISMMMEMLPYYKRQSDP